MKLRLPAIVAAIVTLLFGLGVPSAVADQRSVTADPNDTPGKLDMNGVGIVTKNNGTMLVGIRTFADWTDRLVDDDGANRVLFYFNVDRDRRVDYIGRISNVSGQLEMSVTGDRTLDPMPVTRVSGNTIEVRLAKDSPLSRASLRFYAKTRLEGHGTCSHACVDRAPDRSALSA